MRAPPPPLAVSPPHLLLSSSSSSLVPAARRLPPPPPAAAVVRSSVSVSTAVEAPTAAAEPALGESAAAARRRRLILLRHGESAAGGRLTRDHDRPLSKAGRAAAISVSNKLQQMGWLPELVLCSDATRTKETLKILQEHVKGLSEAIVHFIPSFYSIAAMDGQTAEHLQKAICEYSSDEILTVMCMGHNKGWEEAASMFSGDSVVLKTCNAALLEAEGKSWVEYFSYVVDAVPS
uniref:Phosphoglycerate mutase family protein n=1 Tax=Leersia perrieri TaxID=77586 RepID=A0A0D9XC42_9ORYZ